jgi:ATP-binding cassette subfamily A (ABC1) protein 3
MALGFKVIIQYEGTEEGLQWNNILEPATVDDDLHLGYVLMMLLVDAFLYLMIALYVEKIYPGDYGVPEKWNYPFTASYWRRTSNDTDAEMRVLDGADGVSVKDLRKVFSNNYVAVEGLNLNMKENQVTVLLGLVD